MINKIRAALYIIIGILFLTSVGLVMLGAISYSILVILLAILLQLRIVEYAIMYKSDGRLR